MSTVLLRAPATAFASQMAMMREWLNDHGYEPLRFAFDGPSDDVFVIRLDFNRGEDAEAFAKRFSGQAIGNGGEETDLEVTPGSLLTQMLGLLRINDRSMDDAV